MSLALTFIKSNVTRPLNLSLRLTLVGLTGFGRPVSVPLEPVFRLNGLALVNTFGGQLCLGTLALGSGHVLPLNVLLGLDSEMEQIVEVLLLLPFHLSCDTIMQTVQELSHKCLLGFTGL